MVGRRCNGGQGGPQINGPDDPHTLNAGARQRGLAAGGRLNAPDPGRAAVRAVRARAPAGEVKPRPAVPAERDTRQKLNALGRASFRSA